MKYFIVMSAFFCSLVAADETERPLGGWRSGSHSADDYMQEVHYPAVRTNANNKSAKALISGRIKTHPKKPLAENSVARLIVNGAALPLSLDGDSYARPYAFGAGSNSIEVRAPNGQVAKRTQFFEANENKIAPKLRIILAWDTDHTDVDLHVVAPNGEHAWYGNRVIPSGGALDIDVTDGFGPEIFSSLSPQNGLYQVYANYYGGSSAEALTVATVTVIQHEGTMKEKRENFTVPLRKAGELNFLSSFIFQK